MKRIAFASVALASVFLAGCGGTPDCGDMDTLEVLDQAIETEVEKYAPRTLRGTSEEFVGILDTYEISNIRMLDYDKDADSYRCDARITYVYHSRKRSVDFTYRVDTDQTDGKVLIEYQSKMLDPILGYALGF
ncbi:hypothetical protein [Pseudoxanthomonas wuyuanensis]|uniref:DUF3887 domain-containing protein n=1 Tax=Pseudoxanthomonas wuyuanensis TaxID=1073196 RepID=A0A286D800_9GAMM|nr:hypothetical protein [Pseudoxanthomonas wuyuanensis]SOD54778.1 hypothetical protein SAMN06296416_10538 [Pseudoxanthomonas wuyuanensis]